MRVNVTGHRNGTLLRIRIAGRLILDPCLASRHWRRILNAAAGRVLALDMSGVTQMDAAGLGLLVMLAVEVRRRHGRLRLMCATPRTRTLVRITGLCEALGLVRETAVARAVRRRDVLGGRWIAASTGIDSMPEPGQGRRSTTISTRRFRCRLASLSLSAAGRASP
jgi:anti-anti-sigma factor